MLPSLAHSGSSGEEPLVSEYAGEKMNDEEIRKLFEPLFADLRGDDSFPAKRPLLAHYTSIPVLEAILRNNEVWFESLFMNDMEEVRFGMTHGANLSQAQKSNLVVEHNFDGLRTTFNYWYINSRTTMCWTPTFLSWSTKRTTMGCCRCGAATANGNGAAIVFDTAKLTVREESLLIISKVHYGTAEERLNWLRQRIREFAEILGKSAIPDDKLAVASFFFFERLKLFAIFTKHRGFGEEERMARCLHEGQR